MGLNAAIAYKNRFPKAEVLVLERGTLPMGASTKNAGFACFGSVSELLSDLEKVEEKTVFDTVKMRLKGLQCLRKIVGDNNMEFINNGGFEVFDDKGSFERCAEKVSWLNAKLKGITGIKETFRTNSRKASSFGMKGFQNLIESPLESQINTGKMMRSLLSVALRKGVIVLNNIQVEQIEQLSKGVQLLLNDGMTITTKNVIVATNGFAKRLISSMPVIPARTQVLITEPVKNLKLKGVFHYDEGYFYFRNVGDRVLFGGGRNLDFKGEETDEFGLTKKIQQKLDEILKEKILPGKNFKVDHRWSGIMGLGSEKKPIIKKHTENIIVAVRMGGMGVAIGSLVGEMAVDEISR